MRKNGYGHDLYFGNHFGVIACFVSYKKSVRAQSVYLRLAYLNNKRLGKLEPSLRRSKFRSSIHVV